MGDYLIMSKKELNRKTLLEAVRNGRLTLTDCCKRLDISYRQIKRIWKAYLTEGDKGLCHKNRGRQPYNTYPLDYKEKVLGVYKKKYLGFGPTLASEKLEQDDGIKVNDETLRLWLAREGLWVRKRKYVVYRERRERRSRFGDLVQIDGSIHDWFSEGKHSCLLNMVDDATGTTFALLDTGETTHILLTCLKRWIEKYGIPKSVYVDLKSVYIGSKNLENKYKDLDEEGGFSVFQQVCQSLDIEIIKAYSAQAKGRVERKHQVFQDRFLKDLKLYEIKTINEANKYLENKFLDHINKKFACSPKDSVDAHRDPKPYGNLNEIICWQHQRQLRNDWSIRFENTYFQLLEPEQKNLLQPGCWVILKRYLNGEIRFWYEHICLEHKALSKKPIPPSKFKKYRPLKGPISSERRSAIASKFSKNSSWRQTNGWLFAKNPPSEGRRKP